MLLFINSIGGGEIVLILLFVLIFFGAESIPGLARGLGRGIRQVKNASQDLQDEIRKTSTEIKRDINVNKALHEARNTIEAPIKEISKEVNKVAGDVGKQLTEGGESTQKTLSAPLKEVEKEISTIGSEIKKTDTQGNN